jgi:hypothetical protein
MFRILALVCLLALGACASSAKITHTWVAEDIHDKDLQGVLVLAISEKPDARQRFERAFTDALKKRGVNAVASYELKGGAKITKADIIDMGRQANLDTVLVTTFAGKDQHEVLHPGRDYYGYQPMYNRGYYGRGSVHGVPYYVGSTPDFYAVHKSVHLEANLYAITSEEHLWLAASGVDESDNVDTMLNAFISAFIKQLSEQGLVH